MVDLPRQAYTKSIQLICEQLDVDPNQGLSQATVSKRRKAFGDNALEQHKVKHPLLIFIEQFFNPVIYVLFVAAILAFSFSDTIEGIAVLIVILVSALIGFTMEWQAVKSMAALRQLAETIANVLRAGKTKTVKSKEIVPGDIVLLEMGDVVPADARLLEHENLAMKEAMLTGESVAVTKNVNDLKEDTPLAERSNMVFKGTHVTRGTAKVVVTATAKNTELGKISEMTKEVDKEDTPLDKKLNRLSRHLIWLTIILAGIIAVSGYLQGKDVKLMIETAIALAVAAIPEGLPIVATIALARGMLRLAKKQVIIKKLRAVQTLGETEVICTDKTGTLTENEMVAQEILTAKEQVQITKESKELKSYSIDTLIKVGILCNNVSSSDQLKGDPVEVALIKLARKYNYDIDEVRSSYAEVTEIPFDTELKMMATVNKTAEGYMVCVKGALEEVLNHCSQVLLEEAQIEALEDKGNWREKENLMAGKGLRTLAFAYKKLERQPEEGTIFKDLTFIGIVGFIDPPREDVKHAIQVCKNAGIRVVMITGDHPETARKIAVDTSLLEPEADPEKVMHGNDLKALVEMSDYEKQKVLDSVVFARVTPAQKLDLVSLYQSSGLVVGMTGDGVNDAPALKKADIGIAMGIRGSEAAKETADIILKDDKFTAIELAIRQGRVIFNNIRKFIVYLLSSNLAEIFSVALAALTNLPLPLLPLQILYLNLVTDVFPALALGMGEGEKEIMNQPPRSADEPIMPFRLWKSTVVYGLCITAGVLGIVIFANYHLKLEDEQINNMAFYTLVLAQLLNVFNMSERSESFFNNDITKNLYVWGAIVLCILLTVMGFLIPFLRSALSLVPLSYTHLLYVIIFSVGTLLLAQLVKRLGLIV